mmetsp:Transcript_8314/g.12804  ORF Transcript_8314/g.12804 Transcript_8314/m.12804 type:complete len:299 (+) Transcript_8314:34-930(+)
MIRHAPFLYLLLLHFQATTSYAFAFAANNLGTCIVSNVGVLLRAKKEEGYKFGDISRGLAKRFTKQVEEVTGKEYEFGDLSRHLDKTAKSEVQKLTGKDSYEFGDLSRWADSSIKKRVCEMTGKKEYQVGDISKELIRRILEGEVKWDEVLMLLKALISLGASFSPVAGALPAKVLIDLLNYSIAAQVGEKVVESITKEIDRRMKQAVTGDPEYRLGDFTKAKILNFVGKDAKSDEYQFGDFTSAILKKIKEGEGTQTFLFGDETSSDELELKNDKILKELEAWDKAFKIEKEKPSKK